MVIDENVDLIRSDVKFSCDSARVRSRMIVKVSISISVLWF